MDSRNKFLKQKKDASAAVANASAAVADANAAVADASAAVYSTR